MLRCWCWVSRRLPPRGPRPAKGHSVTVSVNGDIKHTSGGITANSGEVGDHNVAVAVGKSVLDPSSAFVSDTANGSQAIAINGGSAQALDGSHNTAVATGTNNATAQGGGRHCHNTTC